MFFIISFYLLTLKSRLTESEFYFFQLFFSLFTDAFSL